MYNFSFLIYYEIYKFGVKDDSYIEYGLKKKPYKNRIKENSRNQFKVANINLMEKSLLWTDHHSEYKE